MAAQFGRPSAAQIAAEDERKRKEALAARVTAAAPPNTAPLGQRVLAGYRVARTFSDVSRRPHRIFRAGDMLTEKKEVERLAKLGAMLEPVEAAEDAKPKAVAEADAA